jgi:hypothetical protein
VTTLDRNEDGVWIAGCPGVRDGGGLAVALVAEPVVV